MVTAIVNPEFVARLLAIVILLVCGNAHAGVFGADDLLMVQAAPTAYHFDSSPDHSGHSWMVGIEWQSGSRWIVGGAYFNNSFDQKSEYFYAGKTWPLDALDGHLYFKLSAGLLLGYKEPYENKIPFNDNGKAFAAVPALGIKLGRFNAQVDLLGTAGLMFTVGYDIAR